jgi:hypothetical protein
MLIKDPAKRPSMRKILEKEFLSRRISKLLTSTIARTEFTETFLKKHIKPYTRVRYFENLNFFRRMEKNLKIVIIVQVKITRQ